MSIKKYCEMTAFPLIDIMRQILLFFSLAISHGNGFWWDFEGFWLYLIEGGVCMYFYKSSADSCFRNVYKYKHRLERLRSTPVALSEPHCAADVCSVNCLSINGRQSPLYVRAATY